MAGRSQGLRKRSKPSGKEAPGKNANAKKPNPPRGKGGGVKKSRADENIERWALIKGYAIPPAEQTEMVKEMVGIVLDKKRSARDRTRSFVAVTATSIRQQDSQAKKDALDAELARQVPPAPIAQAATVVHVHNQNVVAVSDGKALPAPAIAGLDQLTSEPVHDAYCNLLRKLGADGSSANGPGGVGGPGDKAPVSDSETHREDSQGHLRNGKHS